MSDYKILRDEINGTYIIVVPSKILQNYVQGRWECALEVSFNGTEIDELFYNISDSKEYSESLSNLDININEWQMTYVPDKPKVIYLVKIIKFLVEYQKNYVASFDALEQPRFTEVKI